MLLADLSEKKSIYQDEPEKLHEYLRRKYFDRMSDSMKKSTFRSFWKLCFCLPDDEECQRNISINRKAMEFLFSDTNGILDFMKTDSMFAKTSPDDKCVMQLCILLAHYPQIYSVLSDDTKLQISALISKNSTARIISWFTSSSKATHMQKMIDSSHFGNIDESTINFVADQYELSGDISCFIDYCIEYFGHSSLFDTANERYWYAIRPFLPRMTHDQYLRLITVVNSNDQIYNRNANYSTNTEIVAAAHTSLGEDFDYSKFSHFSFDSEKVLGTEKKESADAVVDAELPF